MKKILNKLNKIASSFYDFAPLLARIVVGYIFIESGWGKLHHLENVVGFFRELGIPAPELQAPFVAGVELVGGVLILFGLLTRISAVPLVGTMVVAIITAKKEDISSLSDLFATSEFLYIVLFVWLIVAGAGKYSLDNKFKLN
jgi:putative oxidoreductase